MDAKPLLKFTDAHVELAAERLHLGQQLVEPADALVGVVDQGLAALAKRLGEAFEVFEVSASAETADVSCRS